MHVLLRLIPLVLACSGIAHPALGEWARAAGPDASVERFSADGLLHIRLQPLGAYSHARITTPQGVFAGRDHLITITTVHVAPGPAGAVAALADEVHA